MAARQYLEFEITRQTIKRLDDLEVVGGSKGYLWARFSFCSDWADKKIKYAIFTAGMRAFPMLIEDGICEVPWEVLQLKQFYIGVAAGELIVSKPWRIDVIPGTTNVWSPDLDPTPTLFYAIMEKLHSLEVITENQITKAVEEYLKNHPCEGGGAGLSQSAANLLIEILRNGVYSSDQSGNISLLEMELSGKKPDALVTQNGDTVIIGAMAAINIIQTADALAIS